MSSSLWPLWTAAHQASLSFSISLSLLPFTPTETVMPSNHLVLCHRLLLPLIFPSIKVFSDELALRIRWPKYWSFNFRPDLSWFLGGFRGMELQELQAVSTAKSQREWHSLNNHQKANRELHKIILLWLVGFWGASKDFHKPRLLETILLDLLPGGSRNPADRHSKLQ